MDRFVSRRRPAALLLALTLWLALWPASASLAIPPNISDEPAGDPGDGVLRPSDVNPGAPSPSIRTERPVPFETVATNEPSVVYLLVPVVAPAGQPWSVCFKLVRLDRADAASWWRGMSVGRWHRAP
ncbi:MAG: hypothetical protein IPI48_14965 [bacterium]|nr:hypothetical protein [bacterium]